MLHGSRSRRIGSTSTRQRFRTPPSLALKTLPLLASACTAPTTRSSRRRSVRLSPLTHRLLSCTLADARFPSDFGWAAWAIPSNLLLQKSPPATYLAFNIFMWGVLLMAQAASKKFSELLVLRSTCNSALPFLFFTDADLPSAPPPRLSPLRRLRSHRRPLLYAHDVRRAAPDQIKLVLMR
jgi:hypothetical protein